MSETSPYGVTQNADADAKIANQLVGERVDHVTANQLGSSPASFSTAPYKKPGTGKWAVCSKPDCRGLRKKGSEWCRHHEPAATP